MLVCDKQCREMALDVIIVLDASAANGQANFDYGLEFARGAMLALKPENGRGVVTSYGDTWDTHLTGWEYQHVLINQAFDDVKLRSGGSKTLHFPS